MGKKQASSQLNETAGENIDLYDDEQSFNKKMFCVITFIVDEDIGTCIDYCGTQPNGFLHYTTRAPSNYEVLGSGLMNLFLHVTQCIGWIVSGKLDTDLICHTAVSNFYCPMGSKHDRKMSTRNELETFYIRFDLTNFTNLDEINPMLIKVKAIKLKVEKLHDGSWSYNIPHNKAVITESHTHNSFFPHNFISKSIDDNRKRTGELLGRYICEKYLCP